MNQYDPFERPKFWKHVWGCITYPYRLVQYRRRMRELVLEAARWNELATKEVSVNPNGREHVRRIAEELGLEMERGPIAPFKDETKVHSISNFDAKRYMSAENNKKN